MAAATTTVTTVETVASAPHASTAQANAHPNPNFVHNGAHVTVNGTTTTNTTNSSTSTSTTTTATFPQHRPGLLVTKELDDAIQDCKEKVERIAKDCRAKNRKFRWVPVSLICFLSNTPPQRHRVRSRKR